MVVAGVVLVAVIGVVVLVSGGKDKPKPVIAPPPIDTSVKPKAGPEGPKPVVKAPLPIMPPEIVQRAKALMPMIQEAGKKGMALYDEALKAKEAGDDATWQAKMEEGRGILKSARAEWNDIEQQVMDLVDRKVPEGWKSDEAVQAMFDVYLKTEQGIVQKSIDMPNQKMAKTGRGS
jgi:hypothetical protein